jgi:hypothetical protein
MTTAAWFQTSIHSEIAAAGSDACANLIAATPGGRGSAAPIRFPKAFSTTKVTDG